MNHGSGTRMVRYSCFWVLCCACLQEVIVPRILLLVFGDMHCIWASIAIIGCLAESEAECPWKHYCF